MKQLKLLFNLILLFNFCFLIKFANAEEWDTSNYPNPTKDGYKRCNMKSPALLCDPDAVFTEAERYRLNYEINTLESKTRQNGDNFCTKKGIVAAIAVAKRVRGNSETAVKTMANEMLRKWTLDNQCEKSIVIVVAVDDKKFWVARDARVPVYASEFTNLFNSQKSLFKQGSYHQALLNVLDETAKKAIEKQVPTMNQDQFNRGQSIRPTAATKNNLNPLAMLAKIPIFLWLIIFFIIIPTLCCCCCLYLCCCRKKKSHPNRGEETGQTVYDPNVGGGGPTNQRSNGGFPGMLSGLGGTALIGTVSNFFQNRNKNPNPPINNNNGYQPGVPQNQKGLYPSLDVKDQGGGGQW